MVVLFDNRRWRGKRQVQPTEQVEYKKAYIARAHTSELTGCTDIKQDHSEGQ